jgi:hypothetical protein
MFYVGRGQRDGHREETDKLMGVDRQTEISLLEDLQEHQLGIDGHREGTN